MDKYTFKVIPHKFGNSWVHVGHMGVTAQFYLKEKEVKELIDLIKAEGDKLFPQEVQSKYSYSLEDQ